MKKLHRNDCTFRGLHMRSLGYDGQSLTLHFSDPDGLCGDLYRDCKVEMELEEWDISLDRFKRCPPPGAFRGEEMSLPALQSLLGEGYTLQITEFWVSQDLHAVTFECDLFPASGGCDLCDKIFLQLGYEEDCLIIKEENEE